MEYLPHLAEDRDFGWLVLIIVREFLVWWPKIKEGAAHYFDARKRRQIAIEQAKIAELETLRAEQELKRARIEAKTDTVREGKINGAAEQWNSRGETIEIESADRDEADDDDEAA